MTPFEREMIVRAAEVSGNLAELGPWVAAAAFAGAFCAGVLLFGVVYLGGKSRNVW